MWCRKLTPFNDLPTHTWQGYQKLNGDNKDSIGFWSGFKSRKARHLSYQTTKVTFKLNSIKKIFSWPRPMEQKYRPF